MTDFENLKSQIKIRLQKIVNLEIAKYQEISACKYTEISGNRFFVGAEIWAAKKRAIQDSYNEKIKAIHDEITAMLDAAQKPPIRSMPPPFPGPRRTNGRKSKA